MEAHQTPAAPPSGRTAVLGRRRRLMTWLLAALTIVVVLGGGFIGASLYTDQPRFCASCHEMRPYYDAWAKGPHSGQWCVDCHVGQSYPARFAHKFVALKEVVTHFTGNPTFPKPTPPTIADAQCSSCHKTVAPKLAKAFSHADHASQGPCQACHADSGHSVTRSALATANLLNPNVVNLPLTTTMATVGHGAADVAGHVSTGCTRCHDLKKTGCQLCHTPSHAPMGACEKCHQAGPKWVFSHPTQGDCTSCHALPSNHFKPASAPLPACLTCHTQPGVSWKFQHPAASSDCQSCHSLPSNHFQPVSASLTPCSACHAQPGVSWKFRHPAASSDCSSCHTPPAGHSAGQCSTCHHQTGVSFAFQHPSTGAPHGIGNRTCADCHPNGYTTHSCTCHGGRRG